MNASQLLAQGAINHVPENWERIGSDKEMSDLQFETYLSMIDPILWIDPKEEVDTYDFSTKLLDLKVTMHVLLKYDKKDIPNGIYTTNFHDVKLSHKSGDHIDLSDTQYEDLIKAIEGKLRLRPIVETD